MHMHQKILNGTLPNKQLIVVSIRSGFTDNLTGEYEITYTLLIFRYMFAHYACMHACIYVCMRIDVFRYIAV